MSLVGAAPSGSDKGLRLSMLETLRLAWADEELRARLLFVLMILTIYAIGIQIPVPVPGVDHDQLRDIFRSNDFLSLINQIGGGALSKVSIFALGLGPYIVASIIIQVLTMGNPKWKEEMKEGGEYARRQQNRRTRVLALILCGLQGFGLVQMFAQQGGLPTTPLAVASIIICWTAGSMFLLWLGEQVSERGIGNGVSILIFAGIVIGLPTLLATVGTALSQGNAQWYQVIALVVVFLVTTWFVVYFTVAQRRIPIQHMRRNFGTKSVGGKTSYLPISVNLAGVIPIIFAMTLLYLPAQFQMWFPVDSTPHRVLNQVALFMNPDLTNWRGYVGLAVYTAMIFGFTYFWTAMQYNVDDIADNLKKGGSYIQGIRPGRQTRDFLNGVITRVTFIGAVFLSVAAMTQFGFKLVMPSVPGLALIGGTSLLIMVSVALETMRQIEANLITKQYEN